MKSRIGLVVTMVFLLIMLSIESSWSYQGAIYNYARINGKIISYDQDRGIGIIYGTVSVLESDSKWKTINSKKFEEVWPSNDNARRLFLNNTGKTVACRGKYFAVAGMKEEFMEVSEVVIQDQVISTPKWYGFGKTIRSERIYKYNLNTVTDFVNVLAGIAVAEGIIKKNGRIAPVTMTNIRNEFNKNWNIKWCVTKNLKALNEMTAGVGGWQVYQGLLGQGNCYIEQAPVIRKDINNFMDAVRSGAGFKEESGPAVLCGFITGKKNFRGKVVSANASGALYGTVPGLVSAFKDPSELNLESWPMEGVPQELLEKADPNTLCWLAGHRVLIYDPAGNIIGRYFALESYLTRQDFNRVLDTSRDLIGEGGL